MTADELTAKLSWRYATKLFDKEKTIAEELWQTIENSLILTPSSFGLQPWKFIVITDQDLKQQLLEHSWNQRQIVDCSHLVVLAAHAPITEKELDAFISHTLEIRGGEREDLQMYRDLMGGFVSRMDEQQLTVWAKNQVYIALGQLMTTAAVLGIDTCPMEGIIPAAYDEVLGLKDSNYHTTVACPMGYRSPEDKYASLAKVRYPKHQLIQHFR